MFQALEFFKGIKISAYLAYQFLKLTRYFEKYSSFIQLSSYLALQIRGPRLAMGFRCPLSHFHNLFEEFCSIFIKPNVQIVYLPDCYGPAIVCEALVSEAGLAAAPQP